MAEHRRGRPRLHQNDNPAPQHGNANPQLPAQPPTGDNLTAQAITQLMNFLQQHMTSNPNAPETHDRALKRFLNELKNVSEKWTRENKNRTWENFVREFKTQYISQAEREARRDEFYHLKQGTLTVAQYESQFNRLSKYAPGLVSTKEDKLYKFTRGLRHSLQQSLLIVRMNTYAEAVEAATRIESGMARLGHVQNNSGGNFKRPAPGPYSKTPQKFQKPSELRNTPTRKKPSVKNPPPLCSHCSMAGHTPNDCWRKLGKCLRCGSSQHQIKDCPKSGAPADNRTAPEKPGNNSARVPARVFALAGQEAPEATDVVEGTFLVSNHFARALIDPGSSHSFVAPRFAQKLNVPIDYLSSCFEVSTPMGASQLIDVVYNACNVIIGNSCFPANLISLTILEYDVILGMDWLSKHYAQLDCHSKIVRFCVPDKPVVKLLGKSRVNLAPWISAMRARKAILKGAEGLMGREWEALDEVIQWKPHCRDTYILYANLSIKSNLLSEIGEAQKKDLKLQGLKEKKPVTKEFVEPRSDIRLAWDCIVHTGASAQYWSFGSILELQLNPGASAQTETKGLCCWESQGRA
ncbi:Unknown protein [Striga hermonthica]|uniref:CCHC-type domain-containing protein n=1 Tax=Striga hermonthica TaxID=68872 RepID=A0A9N7RRH8_STRHE|nr:Unknown protein [Striga hermonthica]